MTEREKKLTFRRDMRAGLILPEPVGLPPLEWRLEDRYRIKSCKEEGVWHAKGATKEVKGTAPGRRNVFDPRGIELWIGIH